MHNYLKAIGFSEVTTKTTMDEFIKLAINDPTEKMVHEVDVNTKLIQINKEFGEGIGITVIGEYEQNGELNVAFSFPYFKGELVTYEDELSMERHSDKEAYAGISENINVGVSLIFYLQNIIEYLNNKENLDFNTQTAKLVFAALAHKSTILLEINKDEKQLKNEKLGNLSRNNLLAAARSGDVDAIESLTLEDMDTYTVISRRAKNEDIFTIVDSYFMPFGIESDQYSILGNITNSRAIKNTVTNEDIYIIDVECNNIKFEVCVNKNDILGEPMIGRRFKGIVWLQAKILL